MTLKEKLEAIWNRPGVIHACHVNKWIWQPTGYWYDEKIGPQRQIIVAHKGKMGPRLGPKPKGKGFSYLCKFYSIATMKEKPNA